MEDKTKLVITKELLCGVAMYGAYMDSIGFPNATIYSAVEQRIKQLIDKQQISILDK